MNNKKDNSEFSIEEEYDLLEVKKLNGLTGNLSYVTDDLRQAIISEEEGEDGDEGSGSGGSASGSLSEILAKQQALINQVKAQAVIALTPKAISKAAAKAVIPASSPTPRGGGRRRSAQSLPVDEGDGED